MRSRLSVPVPTVLAFIPVAWAALVPAHAGVHRCAPIRLVADVGGAEKHGHLASLKARLDEAVAAEDYKTAAALRDKVAALSRDEEVAVLTANAQFYEAFSASCLEAMSDIWAVERPEALSCSHPGFPAIRGRDAIIESWRHIFRGDAPSILPEVDCVRLMAGGQAALVSCLERIDGSPGSVDEHEGELTATNLFEKDTHGEWKMVLHQAGPVITTGSMF